MIGLALSFITGGFSKLFGFLRSLSPTTLLIAALALLDVILWMRGNHYAKQRDHAVAGLKIALDGIEAVRVASHEAERLQKANLITVAAKQKDISDERVASFETRLADARALAAKLQRDRANRSTPGNAGMSAPGEGTPGTVEAPADQFPLAQRLIAQEQAIQLDELITWVEAQQNVNTGGNP